MSRKRLPSSRRTVSTPSVEALTAARAPIIADESLEVMNRTSPHASCQDAPSQTERVPPSGLARAMAHSDRLKAAVGLHQLAEATRAYNRALEISAPQLRSAGLAQPSIRSQPAEPASAKSLPPPARPITTSGDLGQLVRHAREQRKMSQQDFADLAGVGRRFLSELENGKTTLEFDKVVQVASAAGIDLLALIRR